MKFNWGTGIFLFYSIFASSLFYQVYRSTQYDHSLVVDNYYEKDLAYQTQYEKEANSLTLVDRLKISKTQQAIELSFPSFYADVTGKILFYRPSDKKQDVQLPIVLDEQGKMLILSDKFAPGFWKIEVDWEANGKAYFDRKEIRIKKL